MAHNQVRHVAVYPCVVCSTMLEARDGNQCYECGEWLCQECRDSKKHVCEPKGLTPKYWDGLMKLLRESPTIVDTTSDFEIKELP